MANASTWLTGYAPEEWRVGYTHLIRAPGDPDEMSRGHGSERQKIWGESPHRRLKKMDPDEIVDAMLRTLGNEEMTFNALAVRMFGLTADVVFGSNVNAMLWDLVEERVLEHTDTAPIMFRKRR